MTPTGPTEPRALWPSGAVLAKAWALPLVECHAVIGSTQDRALALAKAGAKAWTAVVAERQSEGRGRRGQHWESAPGLGLWLSLVLPPEGSGVPAPDPLPVPLRLGAGLADALEQALPKASVQVKWPNDVWLDGKKVAGILAERVGMHTIAGIGLNLRHRTEDFHEEVRESATSLSIAGWYGDPVELVGRVVREIRRSVDQPGLEVLDRLRARDALLGRELTTPDGRRAKGAGLDHDGALRVCAGNDVWRVHAGTILVAPRIGQPAIHKE